MRHLNLVHWFSVGLTATEIVFQTIPRQEEKKDRIDESQGKHNPNESRPTVGPCSLLSKLLERSGTECYPAPSPNPATSVYLYWLATSRGRFFITFLYLVTEILCLLILWFC